MTNSSYGNFDYELCVKILNLLKVNIRSIFFLTLCLMILEFKNAFHLGFFVGFFCFFKCYIFIMKNNYILYNV